MKPEVNNEACLWCRAVWRAAARVLRALAGEVSRATMTGKDFKVSVSACGSKLRRTDHERVGETLLNCMTQDVHSRALNLRMCRKSAVEDLR